MITSCTNSAKENKQVDNTYIKSINVTSYTGYALVFFQGNYSEGCSVPHVKMILIDNMDSVLFKQKSFNVQKSITGKLCITTAMNNSVDFFKQNKYKHKVDFNICNIPQAYNYYVKCWISYSGYEESPKFHNRKLHSSDTCFQTAIIYDNFSKSGSKGKLVEYKILP